MANKCTDRLTDLSSYIYGTTRLGDESIGFDERVSMASEAMNSGVWFHASNQYGNAIDVLAEALRGEPDKKPPMIFKLEFETFDQARTVIHQNIDPLHVNAMDIGQLCLRNRHAEDFCEGSRGFEQLSQIKQEGLVKRYVMEVFPWTAPVALQALQNGCTDDLIDGFIFYLNPLQRFATNELWNLINQLKIPIIGMRTVCGGHVRDLRDVPGAAWKDYLQQRAVEVAPIFERSGITSWAEFCTRFAYSFPLLRATVGSTARPERLQSFVLASQEPEPLPPSIFAELTALQSRWSGELDDQAEPWSM